MMSLDEELAVLMAALGVVLEESEENKRETQARRWQEERNEREPRARYAYGIHAEALAAEDEDGDEAGDTEIAALADLSLFQTSREHYGVFYRVDLTHGVPHLRVYMPEDEGALKMRCYLVRAAQDTPLHEWFVTAREHE